MKKAQIATEFILLIGFLALISTLLVVFIFDLNREKVDDKIDVKMRNYGATLQNEIILAAEMNNGYYRNFTRPSEIINVNYTMTIKGNETLYIYYGDKLITYKLPRVYGNLTKMYNVLTKVDGKVYINCQPSGGCQT